MIMEEVKAAELSLITLKFNIYYIWRKSSMCIGERDDVSLLRRALLKYRKN